MATLSVPDPIEACEIHLAACRYRRQGLVCSTCHQVIERAERAARLLAHERPQEAPGTPGSPS